MLNEQKHGHGVTLDKNGAVFDGIYQNNNKVKGVYISPEGVAWVWEFKDSHKYGQVFKVSKDRDLV